MSLLFGALNCPELPQAGLFEPCVGLFEPSFETVVTPKSLLTSLYTQNQSITAFSLPAKNKYYQPMDRHTDRETYLPKEPWLTTKRMTNY